MKTDVLLSDDAASLVWEQELDSWNNYDIGDSILIYVSQ